jgi:serine/threonine protein kinase
LFLRHLNDLTHSLKQGMRSLHAHGRIHRDLKSLNILVTNSWRLKVCISISVSKHTHTLSHKHTLSLSFLISFSLHLSLWFPALNPQIADFGAAKKIVNEAQDESGQRSETITLRPAVKEAEAGQESPSLTTIFDGAIGTVQWIPP